MKLKPILLPTKRRTKLLRENGSLVICGHSHRIQIGDEFQHIYLIDKEAEIKEGDWCLWMSEIIKAEKQHIIVAQKVITSTDPSLKVEKCELCKEYQYGPELTGHTCTCKHLPLLSEQSIKLLIDYYNKNGKMPDSVEIVLYKTNYSGDNRTLKSYDKVIGGLITTLYNQEGTVDISIPEEGLSKYKGTTEERLREYIFDVLSKFVKDHSLQRGCQIMDFDIKNWMEENL